MLINGELMCNTSFRLLKKIYSPDAIHSAILTFKSACARIDELGEYWQITIDFVDENPIQQEVIQRRIDEYVLRESLERKYKSERDEIMMLAFGQE
jgi:hypothetical protein